MRETVYAPVRTWLRTLTLSFTTHTDLKGKILQIAALSDRGQRLNTLVAPVYQELRTEMKEAAENLFPMTKTINEAALAGGNHGIDY